MEDLRKQFTKADREQAQIDLNGLRYYIIPILLERQRGLCNKCGKYSERYEIDHILYNPKITINELQLLCRPCHRAITNVQYKEYGFVRPYICRMK